MAKHRQRKGATVHPGTESQRTAGGPGLAANWNRKAGSRGSPAALTSQTGTEASTITTKPALCLILCLFKTASFSVAVNRRGAVALRFRRRSTTGSPSCKSPVRGVIRPHSGPAPNGSTPPTVTSLPARYFSNPSPDISDPAGAFPCPEIKTGPDRPVLDGFRLIFPPPWLCSSTSISWPTRLIGFFQGHCLRRARRRRRKRPPQSKTGPNGPAARSGFRLVQPPCGTRYPQNSRHISLAATASAA